MSAPSVAQEKAHAGGEGLGHGLADAAYGCGRGLHLELDAVGDQALEALGIPDGIAQGPLAGDAAQVFGPPKPTDDLADGRHDAGAANLPLVGAVRMNRETASALIWVPVSGA